MNSLEFKIAQIRAGVTKEDIAKALNVNIATIYRKINGDSDFTLTELKELKKILNLSNEDVDRIFFSEQLA